MAFQGSFWRKAAYGWLARFCGGRVIYQIHPTAFWDYYEGGGAVRRFAIRSTLRRADALIAITTAMKERLNFVAPDVPCFVVPNPTNLEHQFVPGQRDSATIAFVGWLVPNKGVFELVDAIKQLRDRGRDVRLIFAGSKDDGSLRNYVARSGLNEIVDFPGWLPPREVSALLERATVLALPSYSEGIPMAILEAMSCGTPIVASTVGGIPEILTHEEHALLIPPRRVDALAAALERVLDDPDLRERMSQANLRAAKAFDVELVANSLRQIYQQVLFTN